MRDRIDAIHSQGAELVIVGNGAEHFAAAFREEFELDCRVLIDPDLRAYRAAGLRRGRVELLSPRLVLNGLRALRVGARQTGVQGDPWQLGGVLVIRPGNVTTYRHVSEVAGDHAPLDEVIAAIDDEAPEVAEIDEPGVLGPLTPLAPLIGRTLSVFLDPTIVLSFDRTGFLVHSLAFNPDDLKVDLGGRRCVISGGNGGLGYEAAMALSDLGADVVLLCRDKDRGHAAATRIRETTGNSRVSVVECDMSDLDSVRRAAAVVKRDHVDVLIHNAGLLPAERELAVSGLEMTFAVHVAGPFLLTKLLEPALARSEDARVIFVSSGGMYTRPLSLEDLDWSKREYDGVVAYAQTKRQQVVLAELLAKELEEASICVNAMHPGWADTPGVQTSLPRFRELTRRVLRTPAEGADTIVWLAASDAVRGVTGRFFFDRRERSTHLLPFTKEDPADHLRLLDLCEDLTGPAAPPEARSRSASETTTRMES